MTPARERFMQELFATGHLKAPRIVDAFRAIDRADFVPSGMKREAYRQAALPIGHDQTVSQPVVVAFMLGLLDLQPGETVLDIGSGSGWTTALLAHLVSDGGKRKDGKVIALERLPELWEFGKTNIKKYDFIKKGIVEIRNADAFRGAPEALLPKEGFRRILAGAASYHAVPSIWKEQVAIGGRIVAPVEHSIVQIDRTGLEDYSEKEYYGFAFVPLVSEGK